MNLRKITVLSVITLLILAAAVILPDGSAAASPSLQMTPMVDPMSVPTTTAPEASPDSSYTNPATGMGTMNCPGMGGTGMTGMSGTSGMMGMGTMQGMSGMSGTSGMQGMGQMGTMPMTGMMNLNDELSATQDGNWFYTLNPWWLLGWVVLFLLVLAMIGAAVIFIVRMLRRDRPAQAG